MESARLWTMETAPKRRHAAAGFRVRNVIRFDPTCAIESQGYETHTMQICYLYSKASITFWKNGNTIFVVCAARKAARSAHANDITYIRFYRKTTRTETIQIGSKVVSKAAESESPAAHDMFDMWDVLIYT